MKKPIRTRLEQQIIATRKVVNIIAILISIMILIALIEVFN